MIESKMLYTFADILHSEYVFLVIYYDILPLIVYVVC
jgi:hypothetical protein